MEGHTGYIGDDQYFGSWQGKDIGAWNYVIEELHKRYGLPVEEGSVSAAFEEIRRDEECAVYCIDLGEVSADKVDDVLLHIGFTGDHADLYLDGLLIADWYTTGQPWKAALKRHGYPRKLELRVYPVAKPTYFEIPVPQGMTLDNLQAQPRYAIKL